MTTEILKRVAIYIRKVNSLEEATNHLKNFVNSYYTEKIGYEIKKI